MPITRAQFECEFAGIQASFGFEGIQLQEDEKEQLRRVFMEEISKASFDQWLLDHIKGGDQKV